MWNWNYSLRVNSRLDRKFQDRRGPFSHRYLSIRLSIVNYGDGDKALPSLFASREIDSGCILPRVNEVNNIDEEGDNRAVLPVVNLCMRCYSSNAPAE